MGVICPSSPEDEGQGLFLLQPPPGGLCGIVHRQNVTFRPHQLYLLDRLSTLIPYLLSDPEMREAISALLHLFHPSNLPPTHSFVLSFIQQALTQLVEVVRTHCLEFCHLLSSHLSKSLLSLSLCSHL